MLWLNGDSLPMLCMQCLNGSVVLRGVWDVQRSNKYYINNSSMKHQVGNSIFDLCPYSNQLRTVKIIWLLNSESMAFGFQYHQQTKIQDSLSRAPNILILISQQMHENKYNYITARDKQFVSCNTCGPLAWWSTLAMYLGIWKSFYFRIFIYGMWCSNWTAFGNKRKTVTHCDKLYWLAFHCGKIKWFLFISRACWNFSRATYPVTMACACLYACLYACLLACGQQLLKIYNK